MMGQASQKTGVIPWTKGADFCGPLAVLALLPAKMVFPSIGAIFMLYARETMTGPSVPSFFQKRRGGETRGGSSPPFGTIAILKGISAFRRSPFFMKMARVAKKWLAEYFPLAILLAC